MQLKPVYRIGDATMKLTTFLTALALMMQTACAQTSKQNPVVEPATGTDLSPQPTPSGGGGFGGVAEVRRGLARRAGNDASDSVLWLDFARPTEKGPFLGVSVTPVPAVVRDQLKLQRGVGLVAGFIEKGSPAETAGVHENDILQKLDDQILINAQQFAVLVRNHKLDEPVKLTVIREAKSMELTAKLEERELAMLNDFSSNQRYELFKSLATQNQPNPFTGGSFQMESSDEQNDYSITRINGHASVVARDKAGKIIYDGPIDTAEQMEKVPKAIRDKVQKFRNWPSKFPTSAPLMKSMKILSTPSSAAPVSPPATPLMPRPTPGRVHTADPTY